MDPFWRSDNGETGLALYKGHVLDVLRQMPAESVHCVVTSPPYWGLRDYKLEPQVWGGEERCQHSWGDLISGQSQSGALKGSTLDGAPPGEERRPAWTSAFCLRCSAWRGSLGLEPTPDLYIRHLVEVFRQVRRVLRRDGTLWLNMGDVYAQAQGGRQLAAGEMPKHTAAFAIAVAKQREDVDVGGWSDTDHSIRVSPPGFKPKDLLGMPWRVVFALQADGWWLRSGVVEEVEFYCPCGCGYIMEERVWRYAQDREIIWDKPNPMPESVTDRPTTAHEYLFLLSKNATYYYDADAIREPHAESSLMRISQPSFDGQTGGPKDYAGGTNKNRSARLALEHLRDRLIPRDEGAGPLFAPDGQRPQSRARATPKDEDRETQGLRTSERMGHGSGWRAREKTIDDPNLRGRRQAPEPGEPNAFYPSGRNKRSVWTIATEPSNYDFCARCDTLFVGGERKRIVVKEDDDGTKHRVCPVCASDSDWVGHFATFAASLVEPCIKAGTSEKGVCPECGAPWERVVEAEGGAIGEAWHPHMDDAVQGQRSPNTLKNSQDGSYRRTQVGWRSGCAHGKEPVPATVLDIFAGSGTTLLVAQRLGRNGIGIDLSEDYCGLAVKRLEPEHRQMRLGVGR